MSDLLTVPQAARLVGVHKVSLYVAVGSGTLPVTFGPEPRHRNGQKGRKLVALVRREDAEAYRDRNAGVRAKILAWRARRAG